MPNPHRFPKSPTSSVPAAPVRPPDRSASAAIRRGAGITLLALVVGGLAGYLAGTAPAPGTGLSTEKPVRSQGGIPSAGTDTASAKARTDQAAVDKAPAEKSASFLPRPPRHADFSGEPASPEARFIANWVADSGDNGRMSFVIIDKKNTRAYVFDPAGRLLGASPVLLGAAAGDDSVPGIGQRPLSQVLPQERTTPAGRFMGEPGRNASGEDIVWVDYDAAVSMHRVRAANPAEQRLQRLASPTTQDNRISFGCINMPATFYENVLSPQFRARYGVVYVLPDVKPVREVFANAYEPSARYRAALAAAGRQLLVKAGGAPAPRL